MSDNVTIFDHRITYLPGQVTTGTPDTGFVACGNGSRYPLGPLTVDQLAEIAYRVKDATWSGSLSVSDAYGYTYTLSVVGSRPADLRGPYHSRSYQEKDAAGNLTASVAPITNELEMWRPGCYEGINGLTCSLTNFTDYNSTPANYGAYREISPPAGWLYAAVPMELNFKPNGATLRVAWVDDDGSGNPLSPGNRRFLKMELTLRSIGIGYITTDKTSYLGNGYSETAATFKLVLSNSSVTCIFWLSSSDPDAEHAMTSEIVLTADSWFPYAHPATGLPVWDTATGLPL